MSDEVNTELMQAPAPAQRSQLAEYIKVNVMPYPKRLESDNRIRNRLNRTINLIVADLISGHGVDEYREYWVTSTRKKLKQGRKWSEGFVEAILVDFEAFQKQKAEHEAKEAVVSEPAGLAPTNPNDIVSTGSDTFNSANAI